MNVSQVLGKAAELLEPIRGAYRGYCRMVFARPGLVAVAMALLCVPAIAADVQLLRNVKTGIADLLPKDAPSVKAINAVHDRLGGRSNLTIFVQSDDPAVNHRFIDELTARLQAESLPGVREIQHDVHKERDWFQDHAALLMSPDLFAKLKGALDSAVHAEKRKHNALLFDDDATAPEATNPWSTVAGDLEAEAHAQDRFPNGYLETRDGKTVLMLIWLGSGLELGPAQELLSAVKAQVAQMRPEYPQPPLVAYSGDVANLIEEQAAVLADLSFSSVLVLVLVGALIILYFRSMRSVLAVVASLVPGLCFTFAIGRLTVGSLNSNSAFLGSIIAGNGINYPFLLLAYYRTQPLDRDKQKAYLVAASQALPGTLGAAATASAAYGGLAAAQFRGFSDFGWIGGLGMITTWILTFLSMPIAVALLAPKRFGDLSHPELNWVARFFARPRAPWLLAGSFVALVLGLSALGVRRARSEGVYETSIRALRNRESFRSGSASWDPKTNEIFGVWLNPVGALVDAPSKREPAAAALREQVLAGTPPVVERVETIQRYVPERAEQDARLQTLARAKRLLTDEAKAEMPEHVRTNVARWLLPENMQTLTVDQVPESLKQPFTEVNGRTDEAVLVFPSVAIDYDDARNVMRLADELASAKLPAGTIVGGSFLFMADVIRLVQKESLKIVLVVCLLVALVLLPIFARKPQRIPISVVTIAAVALCSQAIMLALGVRVNMFNFAAVPITIGVGSDYVVNLFAAMDAFHTDARQACTRMGGAILLCSMTTVVGYLSLVFAQSGALRTFGWAAVLGEIIAVITVLLVIPVVAGRRVASGAVANDPVVA